MSSHWIATRLAEPWEAPSFGAAGKLNKEVLETLLERWVGASGTLDPHVRLGLVVSVPFLRSPVREALAPELERLLQCASEDDDPWVRVMARAVSGDASCCRLDLDAVLADVPPVAETLAALCARLRDGVPARDFRPLEEACFSLKLRAAAGAAPPPPPDAHAHFTVRPAEAAPRADPRAASFARAGAAAALPRNSGGALHQPQPSSGAPSGAPMGTLQPATSVMGPPAPRRAVVVSGSGCGMIRAPPRPAVSNAPLRPGAAALLRAGGGAAVGEKRKLQCLDMGQVSGLRTQESDEAIAKAVRATEAATEPTATAKKKHELLRQQMQEKERAKREAEKKKRDEEAAAKRKEQAAAEARIMALAAAQRAATLKAQQDAAAARAAGTLAAAPGAAPAAAPGAAPAAATAGVPRPVAPAMAPGLSLLAAAAPAAVPPPNVFANSMFAAPPAPAAGAPAAPAKPPAPAAPAAAANGHANGHATLTMAQLPVYAGVPITVARVAPQPPQPTAVPPPRTTAT